MEEVPAHTISLGNDPDMSNLELYVFQYWDDEGDINVYSCRSI